MADIKAGAAENTSVLIDFIGDSDLNAAFGAEQGASAAGNAPVGNEIVLF